MSRRGQTSILDDIFNLLTITPIWVGLVLAAVSFVVIRFVFPRLLPGKPAGGIDFGMVLRPMFPKLAWGAAAIVLIVWVAAEIWKRLDRRLLDSRTDLASIKDISWQEFERLVGEAYRRKGYVAEVVGSDSGDGGVDVRLSGHSETVLVQCKQWRTRRYKVDVKVVRELRGVVAGENANRGIIVTSGRFTPEAVAASRQNPPIELVDGPQLAELIRSVKAGSSMAPTPASLPAQAGVPQSPPCPLCGAKMVLRTARQGQNAGSQFWGCPKYPACRGTRPREAIQQGQRA